jgi:hypothetical protein
MQSIVRRSWTAAILPLLLPLVPASVSANGGVTIAPASQEVVLAPDADETSFELRLTNRDTSDVTLRLRAVDFNALDESGGVAFVGLKPGENETKYGLTNWLRFATETVTVVSGQTEVIQVAIDNRDDLEPGGHYGAVIAVPVDPANPSATPEVDILPATAALVLLKKMGGERYGLSLDRTELTTSFWQLPTRIGLRFQNTGNIHVVPRGTVTIRGPGGQDVAKALINETSATVLPETFRKIQSSFMLLERAFWPGRYEAEIRWRYDGSEEVRQEIITFWHIGQGVYIVGAIAAVSTAVLWITHRKRQKKKP